MSVPIINPPTFTRSSVAYLSDGTQVVANMPRFEPGKFGKAIMLEEGATNLLQNPSFETGNFSSWILFTYGGATYEVTSEKTWHGSYSAKITADGTASGNAGIYQSMASATAGVTYAFSVKLAGALGANKVYLMFRWRTADNTTIKDDIFYISEVMPQAFKTYSVTATAPENTAKMEVHVRIVKDAVGVLYVDAAQLEQKPYATSFIDGTRSPESLTIPTAGVLNPQEGTIECWVYIDKELWSAFPTVEARYPIWNTGYLNIYGTYSLYYYPRGGSSDIRFRIVGDGTSTIYASVGSLDTGWHNFVCGWSQERMYLYIDGTLIDEIVNPDLADNFYKDEIDIGHYNRSGQINTLIDDLRISNRARTDAEILAAYQNNAPLVVDKWTTYKLNFDDNLNFEQGTYTSSALENIYTEYDIINSTTKKYVYKIEWLNPQEEVIGDAMGDLISGSANFDATSNNRRSVTITLRNHSKQYIPSPTSKMWINNKFRLLCGYQYGNKQLLYNQGVYVLGNPSLLSNSTQKEVTIQGLDKWVLLDGTIAGELKNKYIINVGTRIDVVIKSLITEIAGETKYIIDECSAVTPYTVEKPAGSTIAEILLELANIVSYDVYYNEEGYLCFKKPLKPEDYAITPPVWKYTTSHLYIESNRELDWNNIRNSIVVYGMTDEDKGIQYKGFAKDETGSELSIDKIGERVKVIEDDNIYSNDLCEQRARYELQQYIMAQETVNMTIVPNFKMKLDDVINIEDEGNGVIGNYAIRSISFNIGYDSTMNLEVWAIRKIA